VTTTPAEKVPLTITPMASSSYQSQPIVIGDEVDQVLRQYEKSAAVAKTTEPSMVEQASAKNTLPAQSEAISPTFADGIASVAPVIAQMAPSAPQIVQENNQARSQTRLVQGQGLVQDQVQAAQSEFVQVTVKRGDILERIARANGTTVDEIMRANHLPNTKLKIGQVLKVPVSKQLVKKAPLKPAAAPKVVTQKSVTGSTEQGGIRYYTIKSGDNPWAIANKFRMPLEEFLKVNNLNEERARKLKPGDKVRVR
jgi:LysM repeat protein